MTPRRLEDDRSRSTRSDPLAVAPWFVKFPSTGGSRYRSVLEPLAATVIVVFSPPCSTVASPLRVSKLPIDADNELPNPCLEGEALTTSMTPPSFRPYSAGYPPVMLVIECTPPAPAPGA